MMQNNCHIKILLLVLATLLVACSKDDGAGSEKKDDQVTEIGTWPHPGTGQKIKVIDETANYEMVYYENQVVNRGIPVEHVNFSDMPEGLKETVRLWGMSGETKIFRCEYNGETFYHMLSWFYDWNYGIYDASGQLSSRDGRDYENFIRDSKNVKCVMVMKPEFVKDAEGAPNNLIGVWENDWEHAHVRSDTSWDWTDAVIPLHKNSDYLGFTIKQIKVFGTDGQGYLRTIKLDDDGDVFITTDRFRYEINSYFDLTNQYRDRYEYYYTCYFEGGDTIQYLAMMQNNFQKFDHKSGYALSYPWYRKDVDDFVAPAEAMEAPPAYQAPSKVTDNPLVGKWVGYDYGDSQVPKSTFTFVFREDHTGYLLLDNNYYESFAYWDKTYRNIDGSNGQFLGMASDIKCFAYDTGFLSLEPEYTCTDRVVKFSLDENQITMTGMTYRDAAGRVVPITFNRVQK